MANDLKFNNTLESRLDRDSPRANSNRQALGILIDAVSA